MDIIRIELQRIPNDPRLMKGYYSPRELSYRNEEIDLGFGLKKLIDSRSITNTTINCNCKSTVKKKTLSELCVVQGLKPYENSNEI